VAEVIVDTNILLDLYTQDEVWEERSAAAIASAADADVLVINRFRGRQLSSPERRFLRIAGVAGRRRRPCQTFLLALTQLYRG
jgi:hypothetical protein